MYGGEHLQQVVPGPYYGCVRFVRHLSYSVCVKKTRHVGQAAGVTAGPAPVPQNEISLSSV